MKGFLLDTNVPSELTRPRPAPHVADWLEQVDDEILFFSVISLAEVVKGVARLPESKRRADLQEWLDNTLRPWFADRILPISEAIAERFGRMAGELESRGQQVKMADGFIAATALEHDLTVVTRNVKDFEGLGVLIFDPWK